MYTLLLSIYTLWLSVTSCFANWQSKIKETLQIKTYSFVIHRKGVNTVYTLSMNNKSYLCNNYKILLSRTGKQDSHICILIFKAKNKFKDILVKHI
jgi:hypothetical protein